MTDIQYGTSLQTVVEREARRPEDKCKCTSWTGQDVCVCVREEPEDDA